MYDLGCDTSKWQGISDKSVLRSTGMLYNIHRVCYGTELDTVFIPNYTADHFGMDRATYGYYLASIDPAIFAAGYYQRVKSTGINPAWVEVDFEWNRVDGIQNHPSRFRDYPDRCMSVLDNLSQLFATVPVIYTNRSHIQSYFKSPKFSVYPLHIANYNVAYPYIPDPFYDWFLWQFRVTKNGKYYGVQSSTLDLNMRKK